MSPTPPDPPEPDFDQPDPEPVNAAETPTVDAATPEGVRAQTRRQALRQRSSAEFWQDVFSTPEGRREMYTVLKDGGLFETRGGVSANGSYDPVMTSFHHGQKAHVQQLFLQWLGYAQEGVMLMLAEHNPIVQGAAKDASTTRRTRKPRPK